MEELKPKVTLNKEDVSAPIAPKPVVEKVEVSKDALDKLIAKVEMLEAVADKGRVFNYKNKRATKKPMTIKLSVYEDKYLIGWRNAKDIIKYHPMTGVPVGEEQQMEIILLDKEGKTTKEMINSYTRFSDIKYEERVDCEVLSKSEDFDGNWNYEVKLPSGQTIKLASQFVN